ncbi:DUF262 domain-containing protein [Prevotella nigrescens]|mgnify:CR=1 FL=1|jgi:hypothetical protein|uniref:DUF262 domain-containing protein n=1 Tax=Prevotella nigrescens TaxID=28133 RepID=UPI00352DA402
MGYNMNDKVQQIPMKSFMQLCGKTFIIPSQQRGYKWTPDNIKELISDLWEFLQSNVKKKIYCLQPLAVVEYDNGYSVLDGQQRLTTLFLLYKFLSGNNAYTMSFERDENESGDLINRWDFLSNINVADNTEEADKQIDLFFIKRAYQTICDVFNNDNFHWWNQKSCESVNASPSFIKQKFKDLLEDNIEGRSVQVIWYKVDSSKAYETFRNLNSGKISLTNTELIKALFLNRNSGLPVGIREEAAHQFEEMEQMLSNDHFWNMISSEEPIYPQTRMDLLFNVVAGITGDDAEKDFRKSFRWFANNNTKEDLYRKWNQLRHTFLRLLDMYKNIYIYHYIGFLTYCRTGDKTNYIRDILQKNREISKSDFVNHLRGRIRRIVNPKDQMTIDSFAYDNVSRKELRQLFLLHNIETLLSRYESLKNNRDLQLAHEYEQFPFELLNKQRWDIEHITSQTDSNFQNEQDRTDWLKSIMTDYPSFFNYDGNLDDDNQKARILRHLTTYNNNHNEKVFRELYKAIVLYNDSQEKGSIKEEKKNQLGNLVLLDSHTNRSFHNSLFPRKRRIVVIAHGLSSPDDEESNVVQVYIPPCTIQCFTKAYSKTSSTKLNAWVQSDADAYVKDIKQKLCDTTATKKYFKE